MLGSLPVLYSAAQLDDIVAQYGPPLGFDSKGRPVDTAQDCKNRIGRAFHRAIRDGQISLGEGSHEGGRTDAAVAEDAAEVFWTNELEQMLSAIMRPSALLPVRSTLRPGQTDLVYDIETPTGQAGFVDPDGMRSLPQVGEFAEHKKHTAHWSGVGYGFGLIEAWQAAERGGPSIDQSRSVTARNALDRFNERVLLHGDAGHSIAGILSNSQSMMADLGANITSLVGDPDGALVKLQIIDHYFQRIASSYGGSISSIVAPRTDLYALQRMQYGASSEGDSAWPKFLEMIPWASQIKWVDGIETASSGSGPLWVAWSDDANELWSELTPTPMVFGPFTDGTLRTSFALLTHIGGVILRRRERMARFEFDA
jgi:hypothetical protein